MHFTMMRILSRQNESSEKKHAIVIDVKNLADTASSEKKLSVQGSSEK